MARDAKLDRPPVSAAHLQAMEAQKIPLVHLDDACKGCEDEDVEGFPSSIDLDMDSLLLGNVKNYGRMVLCSTGVSDWPREVTDEKNTLAGLVKDANDASASTGGLIGKFTKKLNLKGSAGGDDSGIPGVFATSAAAKEGEARNERLSILNASFITSSHEEHSQSAIILPDFKMVKDVPETVVGAAALVNEYLKPEIGRAGLSTPSTLKTWPLPYHAVVLLCSHKKRDKRCHITAPLLINQLHHHLEANGLEGDERGDDVTDGPAIEEWDAATREQKLEESLKGVKVNGGRVGIFKISHIGGHKYAGNMIIAFPNGTSIWYGRVLPSDIGGIVKSTIMDGKVIPELLRGGLGLSNKVGEKGVLQW
ncbi:sucrase/ferredoxin-like family protein [Pseudohyphozyma bogoriensis]|nr:sucrase/ferredoxin-like family protein [Pseudohyphozyma bogoriensis]